MGTGPQLPLSLRQVVLAVFPLSTQASWDATLQGFACLTLQFPCRDTGVTDADTAHQAFTWFLSYARQTLLTTEPSPQLSVCKCAAWPACCNCTDASCLPRVSDRPVVYT